MDKTNSADLPNLNNSLSEGESAQDYSKGYFALSRDELVEFLPKDTRRVLEVGCGSGIFRAHFPNNVEYWGIEPQEGPARDAARHLTKVLQGTFDDCRSELPTSYFDLVVCNDVIEHMFDHRAFLRDIQNFLTPKGVLIGSVPNVRLLSHLARLLIKRDWEYIGEGTLDYTHLRFFTEKSFARELVKAGFAVDKLRGINALGSKERGIPKLLKVAVSSVASLLIGRDTRFVQI